MNKEELFHEQLSEIVTAVKVIVEQARILNYQDPTIVYGLFVVACDLALFDNYEENILKRLFNVALATTTKAYEIKCDMEKQINSIG